MLRDANGMLVELDEGRWKLVLNSICFDRCVHDVVKRPTSLWATLSRMRALLGRALSRITEWERLSNGSHSE